jgi:hypothetical protein
VAIRPLVGSDRLADLEDQGGPALHVDFNLTTAGKLVCGFSCRLLGWSVKNASAVNPASFDIYDAPALTGPPVWPVNLAANETNREWWAPQGVWIENAIYVNVTVGNVFGSLFFRHVRR